MELFSPACCVDRAILKLANRSNKEVHGDFIVAVLIDLNVIPETIHIGREAWQARQRLQKRVHIACVAQVRKTDRKAILLQSVKRRKSVIADGFDREYLLETSQVLIKRLSSLQRNAALIDFRICLIPIFFQGSL